MSERGMWQGLTYARFGHQAERETTEKGDNTMMRSLNVLPFLNLLRRGVTIDIYAEGGDERFAYRTSTEILDSDLDGEGGVLLTLDATIEDGQLWLPASVVGTAEEGPDCWEIR